MEVGKKSAQQERFEGDSFRKEEIWLEIDSYEIIQIPTCTLEWLRFENDSWKTGHEVWVKYS